MNLKPPYSGLKKWKIIFKFPVVLINNQIASCRCGFNVWWQFPLLHNTPFFHRRSDSYGVANIHPSAFDALINTKSLVHMGQAYATHVKSKVNFIFSCSKNTHICHKTCTKFKYWPGQKKANILILNGLPMLWYKPAHIFLFIKSFPFPDYILSSITCLLWILSSKV